jgi:hypothetical protein
VEADLSSQTSWTCTDVCADAGGTCSEGGNGAGYVYARYDDGSGTFNNQVSCNDEQEYQSGTMTMTGLDCYCDGMPVPPTVRVKKTEGYHACKDVCTSWSLACDAKRSSYTYRDEGESESSIIDCDTAPEDGTHHYVCACK